MGSMGKPWSPHQFHAFPHDMRDSAVVSEREQMVVQMMADPMWSDFLVAISMTLSKFASNVNIGSFAK